MSKPKIILNPSGIQALLKSSEMQSVCGNYANEMAAKLGSGYETDIYVGRTRCNASVVAKSKEAVEENLKSNTILKAMK